MRKLTILLALFCLIPNLHADTAKEVLDKHYARLYDLREAGLKDLSFQLHSPMFAMMLGESKIFYYWKAGTKDGKPADKALARVEGKLDNPQMQQMANRMAGPMAAGFTAMLTPKSQKAAENQEKYATRTVEEKDGGWIVTITRKADTPAEKLPYSKMLMTFDKDYKLLKTEVTSDKGTATAASKWLEQDKKLLMSGSTTEQQATKVIVSVEWKKIGKYWLPTKMIQSIPAQGVTVEITLSAHKIDQGIDDKLFGGKADKKEHKPEKTERSDDDKDKEEDEDDGMGGGN